MIEILKRNRLCFIDRKLKVIADLFQIRQSYKENGPRSCVNANESVDLTDTLVSELSGIQRTQRWR